MRNFELNVNISDEAKNYLRSPHTAGGGKILHIYLVLGPHTAAVKPAVDLAVK